MANRWVCGVPRKRCAGGNVISNSAVLPVGEQLKVHSSPEEAFACYVRVLLEDGYQQIGPREFRPPGGGPTRILTRKSKFGTRLRMGKNMEGKGSRFMPYSGSGFITSD